MLTIHLDDSFLKVCSDGNDVQGFLQALELRQYFPLLIKSILFQVFLLNGFLRLSIVGQRRMLSYSDLQ